MNQRHRFKTEEDYQAWLKQQYAKGGRAKNSRKGFGTNRELAKKYGKLTIRSKDEQ